MATIAAAYTKTNKTKTKLLTWGPMANGDVGQAINLSIYPNKTIHFYGTFGVGGSITLRGSNKPNPDPTVAADWAPVNDWSGSPITKTANAVTALRDQPLWLSPIVTAGDGSTSLTAALDAQDSA